MHTIEADYLVVGAGAMAMAFIDALVAEASAAQARVVVVDCNHAPGGHWTMAYPFVRLHQPSAFYGVNSLPLGGDAIDQVGWNRGFTNWPPPARSAPTTTTSCAGGCCRAGGSATSR